MRKPQQGGIVAVHAHPDDESITMGATLARYAAAGTPVTLVTATLGEQGETMYGRWDGLDAAHADQLGGYRYAELQRACAALGVGDHRMLGGLGRFRDSGMAGEPGAAHPRAFIGAQRGGAWHEEAVAALMTILREVRPAVILSYDATGGYGHPDHIAAREVAFAAAERVASSPSKNGDDVVPGMRLLEVVRPRRAVANALESLWADTIPERYTRPSIDELGTLVDDEACEIAVAAGDFAAARRAAMAAHATQLDVWAGSPEGFALTNRKAQPLLGEEYFRVVLGLAAPTGATDLLAGMSQAGHAIPSKLGGGRRHTQYDTATEGQ